MIMMYLTLQSHLLLSPILKMVFESRVCIIFHILMSFIADCVIQAVYDATGSVKGVTYKDITLSSISDYGIVIEQDYENGSPTGNPTTGVPITSLTLDGITGTVDADATNIYILCGSGSCSDWTWTGVSVTGGKTSTKCTNIPSGASC